ncbi:hypothetical protein CAPTEDRAFT_215659 [Capitella teleta]|uniref:Uncharacterized protein n=1 Tax=Capitella teleta TaxID=283909 RepID=R7UIX3_CAPTE|nr:hypothetical protein CAPTEDRAFT_215659 [Capitella teleta]|eukprot:ELU06504.1 hypothetical protein CAPTEDRAFT_215659 [Capitella teleta]
MGGLLFSLFAVILYTRMWKRRHSGWDYLYVSSTIEEEDLESGNVKFLSFKALIKAKTEFLANELKKQSEKLKRNHRKLLSTNRVKYMKLDTIGEYSDGEDEDGEGKERS